MRMGSGGGGLVKVSSKVGNGGGGWERSMMSSCRVMVLQDVV